MNIPFDCSIEGHFIYVAQDEIGAVATGLPGGHILPVPVDFGIMGFENRLSPTVVDDEIDFGDSAFMNGFEKIMDAVAIWRKDIRKRITGTGCDVDADHRTHFTLIASRIDCCNAITSDNRLVRGMDISCILWMQ